MLCAQITTGKCQHFGGFKGGAGVEESTCQHRRHERRGFDTWIGKIPWSRKWQPTPVLLRKTHGQRSLAGYRPQRRKESNTTEVTYRFLELPALLGSKTCAIWGNNNRDLSNFFFYKIHIRSFNLYKKTTCRHHYPYDKGENWDSERVRTCPKLQLGSKHGEDLNPVLQSPTPMTFLLHYLFFSFLIWPWQVLHLVFLAMQLMALCARKTE